MPAKNQLMEALHSDVREMRSDVRNIMVIQERQAKSLEEHVYRTNLLEEAVSTIKAEVQPLTQKEIGRAALTRVAVAISGMLVAAAAACEIIFHLLTVHHY